MGLFTQIEFPSTPHRLYSEQRSHMGGGWGYNRTIAWGFVELHVKCRLRGSTVVLMYSCTTKCFPVKTRD